MDLSAQWPYIEQIAELRLQNNITKRHVDKYGTYIEVNGAAGELAARRFLGLDEELHAEFDGGADILYKGMRLDIKATIWTPKLQHRNLQWPEWKRIRADVILLTAVDRRRYAAVVVGYALPHEIMRATINTNRDRPCREIPVTRLHKASRLLFAEGLHDLYPKTKTRREPLHYHPGARS